MMSIFSNLNRFTFLVSTILVVPLIVQFLIITHLTNSIDCLSLTELHSTLPSNNQDHHNRFRSRLSSDKSLRGAIRNLNHHQRLIGRDSIVDNHHSQQSTNNPNYELVVDDLDDQFLHDFPIVVDDDGGASNAPNYLIVKSPTINGINKRQEEVVMDIPLEYTSDVPYEFYPELWPSNQQRSSIEGKVDRDSLGSSDPLSQVLAAKIADLLVSESNGHESPSRKRVLVKRNHRSGLSGNPSVGGHHQSNRVAPNLSTKQSLRMAGNTRSLVGPRHHSMDHVNEKEKKVGKVASRKLGGEKKVKLNRVPLKSTLAGHQPVKGDFAKLVNGKAVHVPPSLVHSKVNATSLGHKELEKSKKKLLNSKNFRKVETNHRYPTLNLNRKEKTIVTSPATSSMKEMFNEINLPKGPKNIVKRSISLQSAVDLVELGMRQEDDAIDGDDDIDDGDDSLDGNNNNVRRGEDDVDSEVESEFRSTIGQPMVLQSNPWLVDEATRTLMRSLTVKRRKRGNMDNEGDPLALIDLDDGGATIPSAAITSSGDNNEDGDNATGQSSNDDQLKMLDDANPDPIDFDEIPARIVKKDGVTLGEGPTDGEEDDNSDLMVNNQKKSAKELTPSGSQLKSTDSIKSLLAGGGGDPDGDNETFFEEELAEGLISIGNLDDLDKLNKSITINSIINDEKGDDTKDKEKRTKSNDVTFSSSSTLAPLTNGDEVETKFLADDQMVNGSVDPDDQLLMETISKGLYVNNKRKRSVSSDSYFGKVEGSSSASSPSSSAALIAQEAAKFIDVDGKLERIEETLILEALELIKTKMNKEAYRLDSEDANVIHRIESRLNAAYDLEDMRLALGDLHTIMQKISTEDEDTEDDQELDMNNDHGNEIIDVPLGREIYLETSKDNDVGLDIKGDNGNRNRQIGHLTISPSSLSSLNNYRDQLTTKSHRLKRFNLDECPAIKTLTTDCSIIKDVVPHGPLQKIFGRACNWHEVCYSCGELFGLLSSDCDMGFLEQSRLACNDLSSCETASRLILIPLKSRRTFYKQKVPSVCYQHSCVATFLLKSRVKR